MARFVKLGPKAHISWDAHIKLKVLPNWVVELTAKQQNDKSVMKKIGNNHLMEATEEEFLAYEATKTKSSDSPEPVVEEPLKTVIPSSDDNGGKKEEEDDDDEFPVGTATRDQLLTYLDENFDSADGWKAQKAMKVDELRAYVVSCIEAEKQP